MIGFELFGRRSAGQSKMWTWLVAVPRLPLSILVAVSLIVPVQSQSGGPSAIPAQELARRVVNHEVEASQGDNSNWSFERVTEKSGRKEAKAVIQTSEGELDRLLAINGKPLDPSQRSKENTRIQALLRNPTEMKRRQDQRRKDDQQMSRMLKLLPEALLFRYGRHQGESVELLFEPNPRFHPRSREARVLSTLTGEMWVDAKQERIEEIEGQLVKDVRFVGGIGGHLDKGGSFLVKHTQIAPGHWEVTQLNVRMQGKALFFKTLSIQQLETDSHFRRVADSLTLAQAAEMLSHPSTLAQIQGSQ